MPIQAGEKMPSGTFGVMTDSGPGAITSDELFGGKKVVIVSVPGAFTPTCSMNHLPGFVEQAEAIRSKGVDTIACMAVNDVFVMDAWGKDRGVGDDVVMLADGNGEYARALEVLTDGGTIHVSICPYGAHFQPLSGDPIGDAKSNLIGYFARDRTELVELAGGGSNENGICEG